MNVATSPDIERALAAGALVAIGVSGGKDSQAAALAVIAHLDSVGHTGQRILVHADLGEEEWIESYPVCQRLATRIGTELVTVRRAAGGLMQR